MDRYGKPWENGGLWWLNWIYVGFLWDLPEMVSSNMAGWKVLELNDGFLARKINDIPMVHGFQHAMWLMTPKGNNGNNRH